MVATKHHLKSKNRSFSRGRA